MGVRDGEERVQVPMSRALGQELKKLAVDLQGYVDRDRAMDRGPMISYVARWFYSLTPGVQGTILSEGKRLTDIDAEHGVPDFREANARYLASLHRPEWLRGVSEAIEKGPAASKDEMAGPSPKASNARDGFFVEKRAPRKQRKDLDVGGPGGDFPKGERGGAGKK